MADIFLSYSRIDRERVRFLVDALTQRGWTVWWDIKIVPGKVFDDVIEEQLAAARCVVVVWSSSSVRSQWVRSEASEGHRRGVLVPVTIDEVFPPLEFRRIQTERFSALTAAEKEAGMGNFLAAVGALVCESAADRAADGTRLRPVPLAEILDRSLVLPDNEEGEARILAVHLGPTLVIGRCFFRQLHDGARSHLAAMGEKGVHWVLAWDDGRWTQLIGYLCSIPAGQANGLRVGNLSGYSRRPLQISAASLDRESIVASGSSVDFQVKSGFRLALRSGTASRRLALLQVSCLAAETCGRGLKIFRTAETAFEFPPGSQEKVHFLGVWLAAEEEDLRRWLCDRPGPFEITFPEEKLALKLSADASNISAWLEPDLDLNEIAHGADASSL